MPRKVVPSLRTMVKRLRLYDSSAFSVIGLSAAFTIAHELGHM